MTPCSLLARFNAYCSLSVGFVEPQSSSDFPAAVKCNCSNVIARGEGTSKGPDLHFPLC